MAYRGPRAQCVRGCENLAFGCSAPLLERVAEGGSLSDSSSVGVYLLGGLSEMLRHAAPSLAYTAGSGGTARCVVAWLDAWWHGPMCGVVAWPEPRWGRSRACSALIVRQRALYAYLGEELYRGHGGVMEGRSVRTWERGYIGVSKGSYMGHGGS